MRHIDQEHRADRIGDLAEAGEIEGPGIGAASRDDHFGFVLFGELRHVAEIDLFVFFTHLITDDVVSLPREIQLVAVSQVAAMGEIEAHDGVAGLEDRCIRRLVRLRAGVRLDVHVFGFEELFRPFAGQGLHFVGIFAAAVVTLAGIAFGVLVGEDAARSLEDRFGGEVLACDQLELAILPARFFLNEFGYSSGIQPLSEAPGYGRLA